MTLTKRRTRLGVAATPKQLLVLDFIKSYITVNGRPPTYEEISAHTGKSKITAYEAVNGLWRRGLVNIKPNVSRGIQLADRCPTCGQHIPMNHAHRRKRR